MKSNFLALGIRDVIKSVILFFITTLIAGLYQVIQAGGLTWENVKTALVTAVLATIAYLSKNLLTNNKDEFLTKSRK